MAERMSNRFLPILISVLTLADGILHFSLDFILFRGNLIGFGRPPGPPPNRNATGGNPPVRTNGPPPGGGFNPLILPLNELFLLNFIAAIILVLLYWFLRGRLGAQRWVLDILILLYAVTAIVGWFIVGRPNPMNLGYLAKGIEVVLIISVLADLRSLFRPRPAIQATNVG